MIDLDAIRKRDRDYDDVFEAQASMSKDIAHRLVAWPVADRRALLAYVDDLLALLHRTEDEKMALREAAGKVRCFWCHGVGADTDDGTCPDCADLRALLQEKP